MINLKPPWQDVVAPALEQAFDLCEQPADPAACLSDGNAPLEAVEWDEFLAAETIHKNQPQRWSGFRT